MPRVPGYDLDRFADDQPSFIPEALYTLGAAAACGAVARETTRMEGQFRDGGGTTVKEPWDFIHARGANPSAVADFSRTMMAERIREYGAIAVVTSVLRVRESLRVREVQAVGSGSDYSLEDMQGVDAGVIEVAGIGGVYASGIANRKRKQVAGASSAVRRIGIVAFGGPQLLIERVL